MSSFDQSTAAEPGRWVAVGPINHALPMQHDARFDHAPNFNWRIKVNYPGLRVGLRPAREMHKLLSEIELFDIGHDRALPQIGAICESYLLEGDTPHLSFHF